MKRSERLVSVFFLTSPTSLTQRMMILKIYFIFLLNFNCIPEILKLLFEVALVLISSVRKKGLLQTGNIYGWKLIQ